MPFPQLPISHGPVKSWLSLRTLSDVHLSCSVAKHLLLSVTLALWLLPRPVSQDLPRTPFSLHTFRVLDSVLPCYLGLCCVRKDLSSPDPQRTTTLSSQKHWCPTLVHSCSFSRWLCSGKEEHTPQMGRLYLVPLCVTVPYH